MGLHDGAIPQQQGLDRSRCGLSRRRAAEELGEVEDIEEWFAGVAHDAEPDGAAGDFGEDAWSAGIRLELSGDLEDGIADLFCVQPADIMAPVVLVGGIDGLEFGEAGMIGGLFPCSGGEDEAVDVLHFPTIANESEGEVVQEFRV